MNISDQSLEWFIVEDEHFDKVAIELGETKLSLIDNGRKIADNFMELVTRGCEVINLLQRPKNQLFLNSGCFAWAKVKNLPAYVIRTSFEIKSYRQLNASVLRKSLST